MAYSRHVTLIGYRATGKTTIAKALAAKLGLDWVDADVHIEQKAGKTIAEIFAGDGEPAFRDLEAAVVRELLDGPPVVVASGGGAPLRDETRAIMRERSTVVWLKAEPATIERRMRGDATTAQRRPNLTAGGGLDEIVALLAQRSPIYREAAHFEIDTDNRTPEAITAEVLTALQSRED